MTSLQTDNVPSDDREFLELIVNIERHELPRLDVWLTAQLPEFSRARIQKLILQAQVLIEGQVCTDKKYKLKSGDRVCVSIPPPEILDLIPEAIPLDILYEDEHLLVINKPVGMVVHPSAGHDTGTLVHALLGRTLVVFKRPLPSLHRQQIQPLIRPPKATARTSFQQ